MVFKMHSSSVIIQSPQRQMTTKSSVLRQLISNAIIIVIIISCSSLITSTSSQYNSCLTSPGCSKDECCFSIVPKMGPICVAIPGCTRQFAGDCCRNARPVNTPYGTMYGYAILLDDRYEYRDGGEKYLQIWLGIPYAKAPSRENSLRFRRPVEPDRSSEKIDTMHFKPSCSQPAGYLPHVLQPQYSEDCAYLNVYVLNHTQTHTMQRYPILVFFHGGEHVYGSAQEYPGHILAQLNIMVITVQYRLNAFGYSSTNDAASPGNYALWDQLAALRWINLYADRFGGDPNKVTLMGHGSGASDVALHMLSKSSGLSEASKYFHRAILLSGSDLTVGGFIQHRDEAELYTKELALQTGCSITSGSAKLMECLRTSTAVELAEAAGKVSIRKQGWISQPWSPNVDGEFIEAQPEELRRRGQFVELPLIGGTTTDDGSLRAARYYGNISSAGIDLRHFQNVLYAIADDNYALDNDGVSDALEFEYSWPQPANDSMRLASLRQLFSDWYFGGGVDASLKYSADRVPRSKNQTQLYVFHYRSQNDPLTKSLGAYHGSELQYIFGFPYLNTSHRTENYAYLGLKEPTFRYNALDKNVTEYMLYFISNFVINGNATPDVIRNLTWDTYRPDNRTYLLIDLTSNCSVNFQLKQNYHVYHYAFWREYYPVLLDQLPRHSTPKPTPVYIYHYRTTFFVLFTIFIILLVVFLAILIVCLRKNRRLVRQQML